MDDLRQPVRVTEDYAAGASAIPEMLGVVEAARAILRASPTVPAMLRTFGLRPL